MPGSCLVLKRTRVERLELHPRFHRCHSYIWRKKHVVSKAWTINEVFYGEAEISRYLLDDIFKRPDIGILKLCQVSLDVVVEISLLLEVSRKSFDSKDAELP